MEMKPNSFSFSIWFWLILAFGALALRDAVETRLPCGETGDLAASSKRKSEEEPEEGCLSRTGGDSESQRHLPSNGEKISKSRETGVYANGEGFFMWFNGSIWKITDKVGGGRTSVLEKKTLMTNGRIAGKRVIIPTSPTRRIPSFD